jgi:conjugative transfer signal peptidase TraF
MPNAGPMATALKRYQSAWASRTGQPRRVRPGVVIAVITVIAVVGLLGRLRMNYTRSLPIGLYWTVREGPIARGSTVLVCLPEPIALFARKRGYLWRGGCPGSAAPVGKLVLAAEGDVVGLSQDGLSVNGRLVPRTEPLQTDSKGRGVVHYPYGVYTVVRNEVWLYSPYHRMSFDSRYFGPVPAASVESRMVAIWTTR